MGENFAAILKRTDIEKGVYIRPFENVCPCFFWVILISEYQLINLFINLADLNEVDKLFKPMFKPLYLKPAKVNWN